MRRLGGKFPTRQLFTSYCSENNPTSLRDLSSRLNRAFKLAYLVFGAGTRWVNAAPRLQTRSRASHTEDRKGRAKLSSWPSGSIKWKKRSPHSASRGAVVGWYPAASARS